MYLYANQITALPESFGALANLEELHASRNSLRALPESFGRLGKLRKLLAECAGVHSLERLRVF